ncbi:hypothetical protein D3C72_1717310 [compost metagenome]
MGFAPKENPKIAIAVVVENAGYGATWAAPIASLMIEKYLRDSITRPKYYSDRILNASLLPGDVFTAAGNVKPKEGSKVTKGAKNGKSTVQPKTEGTAQPRKEEKTTTSIQQDKANR